jgi:hypothetical protein
MSAVLDGKRYGHLMVEDCGQQNTDIIIMIKYGH